MTTETSDQTPPSERAGVRAGRRARRARRIARRETYFDLMASGFSCERIAEEANVSAATVRREVDRAVAEQRLDAPERYAHLQVARLNKALRVADGSIEKGDMRSVRSCGSSPRSTAITGLRLSAQLEHGPRLRPLPWPPRRSR